MATARPDPPDPDAAPAGDTACHKADAALTRAVYCLDRGSAPSGKIRAFTRARAIVADLGDHDLERRVAAGTLTDLDGIGPSTSTVISDAVTGTPSEYLRRLDADTTVDPGQGAPIRAALRGDLHSHTTWSDGGAPLRQMAQAAAELGHEYLAVTDHSARLTIAHGLNEERLRDQLAEVATLNGELAPFRILSGMEVDILEDGSLDLSDEMLAQLDVVVASVHSKLAMEPQQMTRRMVLAVTNPHVDVLGHCTGRLVTGRGRAPSRFDADIVFAACARFGTAVEINCRPERRDPPEELLTKALRWGCNMAIDTDAHAPGQLEWQAWGCDLAVRMGIPPELVINTWEAEDLLDWAANHPVA